MHYLFLVYPEPVALASERAAFEAACRANAAALQASGYLLTAVSLLSSGPGVTLRVRGGELSLAEGPSAATAEPLAELYVIDARDLNEAIRLAADMPQARRACIEIRPTAAPAGKE